MRGGGASSRGCPFASLGTPASSCLGHCAATDTEHATAMAMAFKIFFMCTSRLIPAASLLSSRRVEQGFIAQRRACPPRVIVVAELDALTERRMPGAPQRDQRSRPGVPERVLLQLHERGPRAVICLRDLETETVRFMLEVTAEGEWHRR